MTLGFCVISSRYSIVKAAQAEYYVSPDGNDNNPGTLSQPFKTLAKAKTVVDGINGNMTGDINVYLRGGVYPLTATVSFGTNDSGTNGYMINYMAYGTEKPMIIGGKRVDNTGWTLHDSQKNIYKKTLSGFSRFRQLYITNQAGIRARYPNRTSYANQGPYFKTIEADFNDKYFIITDSDLPPAAADPNMIEMVVQPHWYHQNLRISSITDHNATQSRIYIKSPDSDQGINSAKSAGFYKNDSYFYENDLNYLDAEGEWYLDKNMVLYYKPRTSEDIAAAEIYAPQIETLLNIVGSGPSNNIRNIQFKGIEFRYTNWLYPDNNGLIATQGFQPINGTEGTTAVNVSYATNIIFNNTTFKHLVGNGIWFYRGVKDSKIYNSTFAYIGGNGIYLDVKGNVSATGAEVTENIVIANNSFQYMGRVCTNGDAIMASFVKNTTIEFNTIYNCPYSGMQIGNQTPEGYIDTPATHNTIRNNKVYDVMQILDDGAGLYTLARQYGTQLYENYIYNVVRGPWAMQNMVAGIYHDNRSQYMTTQNNVIHNTDVFIFLQNHRPDIYALDIDLINNVSSDATIQANAGIRTTYQLPVKVQAENMTLTNYTVENGALPSYQYSNSSGVKTSAGMTGEAKFTYNGSAGIYKVRVAYLEESDGQGIYKVFVNGVQKASWTAALSSYGFNTEFTQKVVNNITLNPGDEIKVTGQQSSGSLGRLDFVEIYDKQ